MVVDGVKQKLAGSPVWLLQQVGRLLFWGASGVFQLTKDKLEEWKEEQRQIKIAEAVRVARIAQLKEKELALKREDAAREALAAQEAAGAIAIAMAREKAIARGEIEPPTFLKTVANGFRGRSRRRCRTRRLGETCADPPRPTAATRNRWRRFHGTVAARRSQPSAAAVAGLHTREPRRRFGD